MHIVISSNFLIEAAEPSFLRRIKAQIGGEDGDPDRHARQLARPKRARNDDDDDGPTYVDEESHDNVSKEDYEKLLKGDEVKSLESGKLEVDSTHKDEQDPKDDQARVEIPSNGKKEAVASIGVASKRKQVKVVGDGPEDSDVATEKQKNSVKPSIDMKKSTKKAKKVKLSFDEP
jgi:hypothetical protein